MDCEGSQNGSMSDTPSSSDDEMEDPSDAYSEQRFYMDTFLDLLLGIQRAIKRSGLKFRNKRADDALVETEEKFYHMKRLLGENRALNHPEIGSHERLKRFLTTIVLSRGYHTTLLYRLQQDTAEYASRHGQQSPVVLEQTKVMIVLRAYFRDEARLTTVQRRLIDANVMRRNRFIYAGRTTKRERTPPGGHEDVSPARHKRKSKTETWISGASQPANIGQEVSSQNPPPPPIITGDDKNCTKEIETVRSATQLGSSFTIGGVIGTGSKSARSAVTKMSARVDYLDYPPCPAKDGSFKCPLCPEILSKEYTKKQRWRKRSETAVLFDEQSDWVDHMLEMHELGPGHSKFALHLEASSRMAGIQKVRCPLCENKLGLTILGEDEEPQEACPAEELGLVQLEGDEHIANHIHEFALHSIPWYIEEFNASDASNCASKPTRHPITFKPLPEGDSLEYDTYYEE
ncbi:hypothetical protein PG997_006985 [Apiospora hydei]|uniref:Uncharacterized protein n=1 Tax=Apiospora hydei TaxID=1337664 RepID=A0ABR1WS93_9PEZI